MRAVVWVPLLLALNACAARALLTAPRALKVPTAWLAGAAQVATNATPLALWWSRFDDPLLAQLVSQAL